MDELEVGVAVLGMSPVTQSAEDSLLTQASHRAQDHVEGAHFQRLGFWGVYPNTVRMAHTSPLLSQLVNASHGCNVCYLEIGFSTVKLGTPAQILSLFEQLVLQFRDAGIKLLVVSQTPMFPGGDSPRREEVDNAVAQGLFANLTYIGQELVNHRQFGLSGGLESDPDTYTSRRSQLMARSMIRMRGAFVAREGNGLLRYHYLPKEENTPIVDDCIEDTLRSIGLAGTAVVIADDPGSWIYESAYKARPPWLYSLEELDEEQISQTSRDELGIVEAVVVMTPLMRSGATVKQGIMRVRELVQPNVEVSVVSVFYSPKSEEQVVNAHGAFETAWSNGGVEATVRFFVDADQSTLASDHWIRRVASSTDQLTPWRQTDPELLTRLETYAIVSQFGMGEETNEPEHREEGRIVPQFQRLGPWDIDRLAHSIVYTAGIYAKKGSGHMLFVFVDGEDASTLIADAMRDRHEVSTVMVSRDLIKGLSKLDPGDEQSIEKFVREEVPEHVIEAIRSCAPEEIVVCDESTYSHTTIRQLLEFTESLAGRRPTVACVLANYDNVGCARPPELVDVLCFSPHSDASPLSLQDRSTLRSMLSEAVGGERLRDFVLYDLLASYARTGETVDQTELIEVIADRHASCRTILPLVAGSS